MLSVPLPLTVNATEDQLKNHQAMLLHWFSVDSKQAINLTLNRLKEDILGQRAEIRFTSDDGENVNGLIGFSNSANSSNKLALAIHPMGLDQQFWWNEKSPLPAVRLTDRLREQGYTVISLDSRHHGERSRNGFSAKELIKRAHSNEPRLYIEAVVGTVRDYRTLLNWAKKEYMPDKVLIMGYSMGAQISLLLASYESNIDTIVSMVPPYVESPTSPVAPRIHNSRITDANVLWLAGKQDQHSTQSQTQNTFDQIGSTNKLLKWFDAGHRLPEQALDEVLNFFDSINSGAKK